MGKYYPPVHGRRKVIKRDQETCVYCGSQEDITVDHVIPKSKAEQYGMNSFEANNHSNLVAACSPCNNSKRDTSIEDFLNDPLKIKGFASRAKYLNNAIKKLLGILY